MPEQLLHLDCVRAISRYEAIVDLKRNRAQARKAKHTGRAGDVMDD